MNERINQSIDLPTYKAPPVIEVVCGISFEKLEYFKTPHFGLFWQKVRNSYPTCQHAPPLGFPPEPLDPTVGLPLPLPRVWLINERKNGLIQLQINKFLYNWRKIHQEESYPRYQTIIDTFNKNLNIFNEFLKDERLGTLKPAECELTYVNHILKGEGWESATDIHQILPDINWFSKKKQFLPEPLNLGWQATFALPEDRGRLNVKLEQASRKIDNHPIFILNLTVRGLGANKSPAAIWDWFEIAHEWIVQGFTDLTDTKIQKTIWERTDNIQED
jgi:uncharacterized protein (TIGR04255 family)